MEGSDVLHGTELWDRDGVAAADCSRDPFANEIDDWLDPLPCVEGEGEFLSAVFPALGALPQLPPNTDDLDTYFEHKATPSMRASYSMNDLQCAANSSMYCPAGTDSARPCLSQSLQSTVTTATHAWAHHRSVSVKPLLESVPEGAPTGGGIALLPPLSSTYSKEDYLFKDGCNFAPRTGQEEVSGSAACPAASSGQAFSSSLAPVFKDQQAAAPLINAAQGCGPGLAALGAGAESLQHTAHSTWSVQGGQAVPHQAPHQAAGFAADSREHPMHDKQELGCDTDSSGNTSGNTMLHHQQLRPSGAALRKSQSALELGSWRKMAAGDMDFIDPCGSVREQLLGLEFKSLGNLTPEERLQKILRYRAKRQMRTFNRPVKYQCRKSLADTRPRVRGRFARDNEPGSVMPHETKKALRDKAKPKAKADPAAVKMEPATAGQPVAQMATFVGGPASWPAVQPGAGQPQPMEHHAAALAHLYNQWGHDPYEYGMEGKSML